MMSLAAGRGSSNNSSNSRNKTVGGRHGCCNTVRHVWHARPSTHSPLAKRQHFRQAFLIVLLPLGERHPVQVLCVVERRTS